MNKNDSLKGMIQQGLIDQAIVLVLNVQDHLEGEKFIYTVLSDDKSTPALIEAVLKAFLNIRQNRTGEHHPWVHSLSHFTKILWERRMDTWIKKFNDAAFKGANELSDPNCCDRLVGGKYPIF